MKVYTFRYSRDGETWQYYRNGDGRLGIYTELGVAKRVASNMANRYNRWGRPTEIEILESIIEWTVV